MIQAEKPYAFRERMLQIHEPGIRRNGVAVSGEEYQLPETVKIRLASAGEVLEVAATDFADFLQVSMNLSAVVSDDKTAEITVFLAEDAGIDLGEFAVYRGFRIDISEKGIVVYGHDARGAAQGLYYIEDLMTFKKAPILKKGIINKKPAFSPQMVHSGYGLDDFPDEYLARVAHEGRDAIMIFTKDVNTTPYGFLDFNDLIRRAERYGIDVYAYSYLHSDMNPEEPGAEEYYEGTYGKVFSQCPGLKGVILVGESVEFPSKDPNVSAGKRSELVVDGIPSDKVSAGWWPCCDYPIWLNLVKKVIRKYNPAADIVFWTYNWGYQPEEARLKLIETLPNDVSLLVTFEMFHPIHYKHSTGFCCDYTLSFEGPGNYFKSEAAAAKKRGLRLYSMTNTAGLTWDYGTIPYEPMPRQWMRRYAAMFKAKDDWGLCGIMEGHHYGMYPSFISKLSKHCFLEPRESMEEILKTILVSEFGEENYGQVDSALTSFSDAIRNCTASNGDQYGASRVGPSYPFNLSYPISIPDHPEALYGSNIVFPRYHNVSEPNQTPLSVRIRDEIEARIQMLSDMEKGMESLRSCPVMNEKLERLILLSQFITNCSKTSLHAKQWHSLICRMNVEPTQEGLGKIYDEMEALLLSEIKNAEETIPLVEADSRLGWEPSMLYMTDRWHLEWKIRQVRYVIDCDIAEYRRCIKL